MSACCPARGLHQLNRMQRGTRRLHRPLSAIAGAVHPAAASHGVPLTCLALAPLCTLPATDVPTAAKPTAAKPKKTPTSKAQPQSKAAPKPDNAAARITGSNTNSTMSSNSNRHFGAIHAWQRAQQLFALMQQQQQQSQAAAANAAAAAAACYAARVPPPGPFNPYASLDAAGLAAAMMRQQASPAGAGLGAPPNLSGDTLLPMTYTNVGRAARPPGPGVCLHWPLFRSCLLKQLMGVCLMLLPHANLTCRHTRRFAQRPGPGCCCMLFLQPPATVFMGWSALIPQHSAGMGLPGASGAAAAAAAAAQALSPNSGVNSLDLLTRAGLSPLPGYSAPCSEAFPLLSPLAGACTSACSPHPLGPGLHPLLLPDDCSFARDTFMSGMQQAGIGGQTGAGRGLSASMSMFTHSDSFSVFPDSSATLTLAQLQERAGMSRSSAVCPSPSPSVAWASNSGILSAPAMLTGADVWSSYDGSTHVGSLSGALSGRLQGLLRQGSMHGRQQAAARDNGPVALEDCLMPPAAPEQAMVAMGLCRLGSFGITPDQMLANPLSPTSRPFGL